MQCLHRMRAHVESSDLINCGHDVYKSTSFKIRTLLKRWVVNANFVWRLHSLTKLLEARIFVEIPRAVTFTYVNISSCL